MLIGLLLASTIFFGMAAADADDKEIEQLEKSIAAAKTKEQRDALIARLNALLEAPKPSKEPNVAPKAAKPNSEPNVIPKLPKEIWDQEQEWEFGKIRIGGFGLVGGQFDRKKQAYQLHRPAQNADDAIEGGNFNQYDSWPKGWEVIGRVTVSEEGDFMADVRRRLK